MGFPKQPPKAFTRGNIERLNPDQIGVHGLFTGERWMFIGSGDTRSRLLAHVLGNNTCITRVLPAHWVDEVTADYFEMGKALIGELKPICNQQPP